MKFFSPGSSKRPHSCLIRGKSIILQAGKSYGKRPDLTFYDILNGNVVLVTVMHHRNL